MPRPIFNFRSPDLQWERMWQGRSLEREVSMCDSRELRHHMLRVLNGIQSPVVIEAGCGIGAWVAFLSEHCTGQVIGIDNYAPALKALKQYSRDSLAVEADVRALPLREGSVDACISLGVVEHFPNGPTPLIAEMQRVLKPGGYLFLTVPYFNLFRRLIVHPLRATYMTGQKLRGRSLYFAEYRFSRRELLNIVANSGFQIVQVAIDEHETPNRAIGLCMDLPLFRGTEQEELNSLGRLVKWFSCLINPWLIAGGILVIARKPAASA